MISSYENKLVPIRKLCLEFKFWGFYIIALEDILLFLFFTKPQVLLFIFFVPRIFKYISVTILSFFEQSTFSER